MMSSLKGTENGVVEAVELVPTLQQVDAKIADARCAQSDMIKSMVVGSFAVIDRRFLHRSAAKD